MNYLKLIVTGLGICLLAYGGYLTHGDFVERQQIYEDSLSAYNRQYAVYQRDSLRLIQAISPPENVVKWKNSSAADPYLSASQGIEVHLKGLSWRGWHLGAGEPVVDELRRNFDATFTNTIDNITFDPDFQNNGYPDLVVKVVNAPAFYSPGLLSEYLGQAVKTDPVPYKSYELQSCDGRKATMDLWLVTFDITLRIEPSFDHQRNTEWPFTGRHPITRETDGWSRGRREFKDMRYDRLSVLMELKPKNNFYVATAGESPFLNPAGAPKIGIGAVECVLIEKVGEKGVNNLATTLGVDLEKGKSLPLYPNLEHLKEIYSYRNFQQSDPFKHSHLEPTKELVERFENLIDVCENSVALADPNLFGQSKYSHIDIKNLGSWRESGSWLLGDKIYNADYYHAKLLVHLYVLGEWVVNNEAVARFEARAPASITRPGVLSYLLPDFKLGIMGKLLGSVFLPLVLLLLVSFFFPPIRLLINELLKKLVKAALK